MVVREHVYADFEYRQDGRQLILGCFLNDTSGERVAIDFRQADAPAQLALLKHRWANHLWFSFAARAELSCFLQAGVPFDGMDWIDLHSEARQITDSHPQYRTQSSSLLATLQAFKIPSRGDVKHKLAMRELILSTDQYSEAEWAAIQHYAWGDVDCLPALWQAIQGVHAARQRPYSERTAIFRCDYLQALAALESRSRGFPVDTVQLDRVFSHQPLIRKAIAEKCNAQYGGAVYRHNKARDEYSFSFKGLESYIDALPIKIHWPRTTSGRLRTSDDFLSEFARRNPIFEQLHDTLSLLRQLKGTDLRPLVRDGFLRGESLPYHTITGRNQPLTTRGFLFNLAPWIRLLCRPKPGDVIVSGDWSAQEVVIAAALSGDRALAYAVSTNDVYLTLAHMAGACPADATDETHPEIRQTFKSAQLGIGYGMGTETLAYRIYLDLLMRGFPITIDDALGRAVDILRWHKDAFKTFWTWCQDGVRWAKYRGWTAASDGWTYYCDDATPFTRLQNFPCQSNAGCILRETVKLLAREPQTELMCSLHDAIYLYTTEDQAEQTRNTLIRAMTQGTAAVLRHAPLPLPIKIKTKIFDHTTGYQDARGDAMYGYVQQVLAEHGL